MAFQIAVAGMGQLVGVLARIADGVEDLNINFRDFKERHMAAIDDLKAAATEIASAATDAGNSIHAAADAIQADFAAGIKALQDLVSANSGDSIPAADVQEVVAGMHTSAQGLQGLKDSAAALVQQGEDFKTSISQIKGTGGSTGGGTTEPPPPPPPPPGE